MRGGLHMHLGVGWRGGGPPPPSPLPAARRTSAREQRRGVSLSCMMIHLSACRQSGDMADDCRHSVYMTMYERTYGYLYDSARPVKEDAASIRRTIKTLAAAELLPRDWTYSVRYRTFAGGRSIDVRAISPRPTYAANPGERGWARHAETGEQVHAWRDKLTIEARMVLDTLEDLLGAHNHSGSEIQVDYVDVKFYESVDLETLPGVARYAGESAGAT